MAEPVVMPGDAIEQTKVLDLIERLFDTYFRHSGGGRRHLHDDMDCELHKVGIFISEVEKAEFFSRVFKNRWYENG